MTGKAHIIFPGFPGPVGTLHIVWLTNFPDFSSILSHFPVFVFYFKIQLN